MPEHEPQVGQAERSITATSASETFVSAAATIASTEVDFARSGRGLDLARLHRPTGDEDGRDVEPQRRHQHAGRDLVAVRDAHQRVGAMGVGHIFDAVGDHLARGQRIEHAVVAHRDAVVDRDGVEFLGYAARGLDLARDQLAEVLEVHVAGHELGEGIGDRDDRLAKIAVLHAGCAPKAARAGHVTAMGGSAGAIRRHDRAWGSKRSRDMCARVRRRETHIVPFSEVRQRGRALGDDGSPARALTLLARIAKNAPAGRGCSSMVEQQPSKLNSCFFAALHGISLFLVIA